MSPADSPFAQLPAPGPHPATAELRAYAAGTLAPADEHRIEAHTLDCERCAELVEGFSMSDGPTTDRAIAELRTRLQARLGQAEPEPAAGGWAWPRLAAAAALLAVVGSGIWGWEKYESTAPPVVARHEVPRAPATHRAAPVAAAPQEPAPASPAPTSPAPADYAAVQRQSKPRAVRQRAASTLGGTDWLANSASRRPAAPPPRPATGAGAPSTASAADMVATSETAAPAGVAQATQAPPAADDNSRESKLARADLAPAAKSESAPPAAAMADTMRSLGEVSVAAAPMKKAKARMAEPASAMVPNTPMPAGFAIKPAPVGGTPAFRDYLRREAAQFEPEKENRISGLVHVQFTVGADGQLSNLKVTRGLRADYDAEALRLVCEGPKWQPGIAGGRRAPQTLDFTVPF